MAWGASRDRGADAHRIGALGAWLRQSRFDELPQILNILRGEMSFIGPRPDQLEHAEFYIDHVPHYAGRFAVRPGISGLAQVTLGYAEGWRRPLPKRKEIWSMCDGRPSCSTPRLPGLHLCPLSHGKAADGRTAPNCEAVRLDKPASTRDT